MTRSAEEITRIVQRWLPDDAFADLFSTPSLEPFVPLTGSDGLHPTLLVHTLNADGTLALQVIMLAIEGFNDWDTRLAVMRSVGTRMARDGWQVVALQFGSEAWTRAFSPEEEATRGTRSLADYPDRHEIVVVFGQTIDGRCIIAQAPLHKDDAGTVQAVQAWTVQRSWDFPPGDLRSPLLRAVYHAYLHTKQDMQKDNPHA